jgi:hypothetical protein
MKDETQARYCNRSLPSKPLPPGRVLVHNHVVPHLELGLSGFRAWTQLKTRNLVRCHCSFGFIKNAEVNKHYRINRGDTPEERRANKVAEAACEEVMSRGIRFRNDAPDDLIFERWQALRKRAAAASARAYRKAMSK